MQESDFEEPDLYVPFNNNSIATTGNHQPVTSHLEEVTETDSPPCLNASNTRTPSKRQTCRPAYLDDYVTGS